MFKKFTRLVIFIALSIAAFVIVHVKNNTYVEYKYAILIGAVVGLLLFIAFSILFPSKKNNQVENRRNSNNRRTTGERESRGKDDPRPRSNNNRNNGDSRVRSRSSQARPQRNRRAYQDTDRIKTVRDDRR